MRIIDANTGTEVSVGDTFRNIDGNHKLLQVDEKILSARGQFLMPDGTTQWMPLVVRYTHPGFFFQKIAFIPS